MDYILICAQKSGKETMSILIPYHELTQQMKDKWEIICKHKQTVNGVNNMVVINNITKTVENHTYYEVDPNVQQLDTLCNVFLEPVLHYGWFSYSSDDDDDDDNNKQKQQQNMWKNKSYKHLVSDYNDINNYKLLLSGRGIPNDVIIYDSVCILEAIDGTLIERKYKTVKEELAANKLIKRSFSKYYLFCAQQANFQTRTLLIPQCLLSESRNKQWCDIKTYCKNNIIANNVIIINLVWEGNCGTIDPIDKQLSELCSIFESVSTDYGLDDNAFYGDDYDRDWQLYCYINLCGGFNHVGNYKQLLQLTHHDEHDIEIVDSILVLYSDQGELHLLHLPPSPLLTPTITV